MSGCGWRPRVVGLDLSLTSTGVSDGQSVYAYQTGPADSLEVRLDQLVRDVIGFVLRPTTGADCFPPGSVADLAVIEGSSFGSRGSACEQLAALRIMVRHRLWRWGVPFALVPPPVLKKYTTGNGMASKQQMVSAVDQRHGAGLAGLTVKSGRYDMADAFALAAMGYDRLGFPLKSSPGAVPPHRGSLDSADWPELLSDS